MIDVVLLIGRLLFVALLYLFLFALMKTGIGLVRGQRKKAVSYTHLAAPARQPTRAGRVR